MNAGREVRVRSRGSRTTLLLVALLALGCSRASNPGRAADASAGASAARARGDAAVAFGNAPEAGARPIADAARAFDAGPLPSDFLATEHGGYKLGPELAARDSDGAFGPQPARSCAMMLAVVRDFRGANQSDGHPDFEAFDGKGPTPGLLAGELGADQKPVYASRCEASADRMACPYGQMTTSPDAFASWYRTSAGINQAFRLYLMFVPNGDVYTFESKAFFPLDDAGFGNFGGKKKHNFGFTTELHTRFVYRGQEQFSFSGDDDLWVYINGKLAIDLGGLHPPQSASIDLDARAGELGIVLGNSYALDLFHAERHSASSNFRVDTSLSFTDCGTLVAEVF